MADLNKTMLIDAPLLGIIVWLVGYLASLVLFFFLPPDLLGWVLFVIFLPIIIILCYKRFGGRRENTSYYILVAVVWLLIAVIFDYLFIVKLFNSQNYYKLDIYIYYASTFLIPLMVGLKYGRK